MTRLGYTDIPEEVRLCPRRVTQRFSHHAATYILDMDYHGEIDLDTFNDVLTQNKNAYKYSINRNKRIREAIGFYRFYGYKIVPIYFSPIDFPIYGADHIRIEISSGSGDSGEFHLALVDTFFYK